MNPGKRKQDGTSTAVVPRFPYNRTQVITRDDTRSDRYLSSVECLVDLRQSHLRILRALYASVFLITMRCTIHLRTVVEHRSAAGSR